MDSGVLEYFDVFLLVFARMGGLIFVHPVFARRGIPAMVKTGLVLTLSLVIAPAAAQGVTAIQAYSTFQMAEALIREVIMGLVIGSVFQLFFYMVYVAGDLMDTVFGLSMGKVMDPAGGVQTAILGQFINVFFFLYFFATGCHLLTVKLFAYTYEVIPVGGGQTGDSGYCLVSSEYIWQCFSDGDQAGPAFCGSGVRAGGVHGRAHEADSPDSRVCY